MNSLRECAAAAQASGISQKEVLAGQMDQDLLYNIHDHHWWQLLSTPFMIKAISARTHEERKTLLFS